MKYTFLEGGTFIPGVMYIPNSRFLMFLFYNTRTQEPLWQVHRQAMKKKEQKFTNTIILYSRELLLKTLKNLALEIKILDISG